MEKILLIDMDGVLVELGNGLFEENKIKKGFFINQKPVKGAQEAFQKLSLVYKCYIVSTPVWSNPECWKEKRLWVEKYLGKQAEKRLVLTHHKNLIRGDYLIDDSFTHGVDKFKGEHIHFGSKKFDSWKKILDYLSVS